MEFEIVKKIEKLPTNAKGISLRSIKADAQGAQMIIVSDTYGDIKSGVENYRLLTNCDISFRMRGKSIEINVLASDSNEVPLPDNSISDKSNENAESETHEECSSQPDFDAADSSQSETDLEGNSQPETDLDGSSQPETDKDGSSQSETDKDGSGRFDIEDGSASLVEYQAIKDLMNFASGISFNSEDAADVVEFWNKCMPLEGCRLKEVEMDQSRLRIALSADKLDRDFIMSKLDKYKMGLLIAQ